MRRLPSAGRADDATLVLLLILATGGLRILFGLALGLGVDESYMVAAGRELRLGYFDHPPAAWWLAWGASWLASSDAALIVRLPFIALFGLSTWLMYRLAGTLYTPRAGLWAAVTLNLAPVFGVTTGGWVLPDGPLDAALLGAALCLVYAVQGSGRPARLWWLASGLCAGLALFAKYSAALTLVGACVYLATQREHRRWLARPEPYLAGLVATLIFLPVLIWNALHGWASFAFQAGRAEGAAFSPAMPLVTLGGEALFLLPWIWLPLMVVFVRAIGRGPREWRGWLLCCLGAPPILVFTLVSAWSSHRVLYHWAAPGYLMLFPLLGALVARDLERGWRVTRIWLVGTALFVLAGVAIVAAQGGYGWLPGFSSYFQAGKDPSLDAVNWTDLPAALAARGLAGRHGLVIAGVNWRDTGKIAYALGGSETVICLDTDDRQFGLNRPAATALGKDVLIVVRSEDAERAAAKYAPIFARMATLPPVTIGHGGSAGLELSLLLGHTLRVWPPPASPDMS